MLRSFLEKLVLPVLIAISTRYLVDPHPLSQIAALRAGLLSVAAGLLTFGIMQWPKGPTKTASGVYPESGLYPEYVQAPRFEPVPKWLTPHLLCGYYKQFDEKDADKIVDPYKAKWMTVAGTVVGTSDRYLYLVLEKKLLWYKDPVHVHVHVFLTSSKPDSVTVLFRGKKVKVRGELLHASNYSVSLWNAELVKAPKLSRKSCSRRT